MKKIGLLAVGGLAAALAAVSLPALAAPAVQASPIAAADLKPDPGVRYGVLHNGMHYQIMRNATPPHNASLRLRIGAGSLYERDDQRGIAHFIEHMVFNGTTHVPKGEFVKRLERAGLKFGPDTNAETTFDETVFMLDLPETDAATVDTALLLLREGVSEALFEPQAIDAERGIVLSEERTRATPAFRNALDALAYILKGDILPNRLPIGLTDILKQAPRERIVDFYNAYYRPDRATLIVVGDFDVDAMEAKIRRQFGDWAPKGAAGPELTPSRIGPRGLEAHVFVEPGVGNTVSLAWVAPPDLHPDSRAVRRERFVRGLVNRGGLQPTLHQRDDHAPGPRRKSRDRRAVRRRAARQVAGRAERDRRRAAAGGGAGLHQGGDRARDHRGSRRPHRGRSRRLDPP
jgi:zinc protease